jgi:imidazolonepropionase-like amidohydrolase
MAGGKFLIPGLWDMHAHPLAPERRDTYFSLFLANGVTGVRDTGAWISLSEIYRWQQDLATGALVGPRIVGVAGPLVDGPGVKHARTGFPNETAVGTVNVTNAADARAVVATLQKQGADFIKVYNQVPREAFFALADEAKHRSMPIIGHVPWSVTVAEASNAGQRSMEHLDGPVLECAFTSTPNLREQMVAGKVPPILEILQSALNHCDPGKMTDLFKLLAKNETWQVPTLVQLLFTEKPDAARDPRLKYVIPPIREEWQAMLTGMGKNLDLLHRIFLLKLDFVRAMRAQGVRFLPGTDSPSYPGTIAGFDLHDELQLLVRAGFTPAEALKSATCDAAEFMGKQNDFGSVTPSKMADLVLLSANPLTDIRNTTSISAVFLMGKEFDRSALDAMLKKAEAAVTVISPPTAAPTK